MRERDACRWRRVSLTPLLHAPPPTGALISRLVEKDTRVSLERVIGEYEARRGAAAAGGAEQQQGGGVRADE